MISRWLKSLRSNRLRAGALLFGATLPAAWWLSNPSQHLASLASQPWRIFAGVAGLVLIVVATSRALLRAINGALESSVTQFQSASENQPPIPEAEKFPAPDHRAP